MQKRVDPASFALAAASRTSRTFMVGVGLTKVLWRVLWLQYEQSSVHPPVLIDRRVHCWTSDGSQYILCTVDARYMSSWKGREYTPAISSFVQS
jgi:hypothetical protein